MRVRIEKVMLCIIGDSGLIYPGEVEGNGSPHSGVVKPVSTDVTMLDQIFLALRCMGVCFWV